MVEYLSGGRLQGSSSAESSTVTTEQDLFNSSFTTSGNASQTTATDTTGKVVMTQSGGSGNNAKAYRTLSNSYNAKTFTIDFTFTRNSGDNANNSGVSFGSDNTADGNISGNAKRLMFAFENGSYIRVKVETVATNNTFTDTTSFQATGTTKYYRFVGNGSNVVLTMFPTLSDRTNGTNADRTYQSVDFPSDWLTTDSIDTFTLEGWSGYHAGNWEVSDVQISMNNYADEKDSLNSVPVNSRYEEIDTRKIFRRVILKDNCIAYYNFDSTTGGLVNQATTTNGFTDGLGSSADGTVDSGVTLDTTNEKLGTGCYDFDGTTDSNVNLGTNSGLNLLNGGTICMWINYDNMTDKRWAGKGANTAWEVLSEGGASLGKIKFRVNDGSVENVISTTTLSSSTWYHVGAVYDKSAGQIKIYINGTLEATTSSIGQIATVSTATYFGRNNNTTTEVNGRIDDTGIWNVALSGDQISALYNSGTGRTVNTAGVWKERNSA